MKKIIVLTSGGVDSSILIDYLVRKRYEVHPVFIRQGLLWEQAEIYWLGKYLKAYSRKFKTARVKPLTVLDIPSRNLYRNHWGITGKNVPGYYSQDEKVYLPGRNILMLSAAAVFGAGRGIREIALGTLSRNPFPDASRKFFDSVQKMLGLGLNQKIKIHTPFLKLKKKQVAALSGGLPLKFVFSCLKPRGLKPCGACNKCREREKLSAVMPRRIAHAK